MTLLSVTDADKNGVMTVRLTDTFFSNCKGAGYGSSPGLVEGDANIENMTLNWNYSFKCYDPATNKLVEVKKGSTKFTFNSTEDILVDDSGEIYHHLTNH